MQSLDLAGHQLRRLFCDSPLVKAAVVAITLVPLLYGALYLWAFWDPYGNLDKIPVALVNLDRPVTADGEPLSAGADLTTELLKARTFGFAQVSPDQAASGVSSGLYYLSLTIPEGFSADLATANTENPRRARLKLVAHESENMIASMVAERAFAEVRTAAGESASKRYLDKMFVGFADARGGFSDAALGAEDLAAGLKEAREGAGRLSDGARAALKGAETLSAGLEDLSDGARKADAGADTLATGTSSLSAGLTTARTGSAQLAEGATRMDGATTTLASSLGSLAGGAETLAAGAAQFSAGAEGLDSCVRAALGDIAGAVDASERVSAGAGNLDAALRAYADGHSGLSDDPDFRELLGISAKVKSGSADLHAGLKDAANRGPALAKGAKQVAAGAQGLASGSARLADGLGRAHDGARLLATGSRELASGSTRLSDGVGTAASGAEQLAAGSRTLAKGTDDLASGAKRAASGSGSLSDGIGRLNTGTRDLAKGLRPAVSGSRDLASGLSDGAERMPAHDTAVQARNAEMMSAPVELQTTKMGEVAKYGIGFAPYFIPVALWVGALLTFFIIPALPARALASAAPSPVTAAAGFMPAAVVGTAQATVLLAVIRLGLGLAPVHPLAYFGVGVLTALVFIAILQFLNAAFGPVGKLLSIVLMMLQLTSAAGTFPVQTSPRFFQVISPWMPMTYVVSSLRQVISGGDLTAAAHSAAVLAGFGALALVGTIVAAQRGQTWTMSRLHPSLKL